MRLILRNSFISLICITIFVFASQAYAQKKEEHPVQAMNKVIEHQIEAIELTKSGKDKSTNEEFMKFFNEMLAEQERDLRNMEAVRDKIFPDDRKISSTRERLSSFSKHIEDEFKRFEIDMKRAFDRFRTKLTNEKDVGFLPKIEIEENENFYEIKAEVPGIARDNIKVRIKENNLIILAKRKNEIKHRTQTSTTSELYYGDYERTIHLGDKVDPKSIKTDYKDGVISVHLNKIVHKQGKT